MEKKKAAAARRAGLGPQAARPSGGPTPSWAPQAAWPTGAPSGGSGGVQYKDKRRSQSLARPQPLSSIHHVGEGVYERDTKIVNATSFTIEREDHTIRNIARMQLHRDPNVLFAGYKLPRPLQYKIIVRIHTTSQSSPTQAYIEMFKDQHDPNRNRGFLFVEYYNHACAEYAWQKLSARSFKVDGSQLTVKTIYVKNLPENVSKEKIKDLFDKHGEVTKIVLPPAKAGHKRDFGFVHFAERSSALKAVKGSENMKLMVKYRKYPCF